MPAHSKIQKESYVQTSNLLMKNGNLNKYWKPNKSCTNTSKQHVNLKIINTQPQVLYLVIWVRPEKIEIGKKKNKKI